MADKPEITRHVVLEVRERADGEWEVSTLIDGTMHDYGWKKRRFFVRDFLRALDAVNDHVVRRGGLPG